MMTPEKPSSESSDQGAADPFQLICNALQRREAEETEKADRLLRRQRLDERLAQAFMEMVSFAASSLARDERSRSSEFFTDLARRLLAFNEMLGEANKEYPRFRILDRLGRAARAGVPALDTVASLLLLEPSADVEMLAKDLRGVHESGPQNLWPMWLTYTLDQLMNSHRPPAKDTVPPDTTREEWRRAETAFGCILFSDESFRVLQQSMDAATCLIDDALKCGGHPTIVRPPARVRDMIARIDPRALHWYGTELPPLPLLRPPPSIEAISKPAQARQQLDEVFTAANCLQIALDKWSDWFVELQQKGDAHPAIALNCSDMAKRAVKVLSAHRPNIKPFDSSNEAELLDMLPPIPAWWMPDIVVDAEVECGEQDRKPHRRWQEDREFLDVYYRLPKQRHQKSVELRGAAEQLVTLLKSFPLAALSVNRKVRNIVSRDGRPQQILGNPGRGLQEMSLANKTAEIDRLIAAFEIEAAKFHDIHFHTYHVTQDGQTLDRKFHPNNHAIMLWQFLGSIKNDDSVDQLVGNLEASNLQWGVRGALLTLYGVVEGPSCDLFVRMAKRAGSLFGREEATELNLEIVTNLLEEANKENPDAKPVAAVNDNPLAIWLNFLLFHLSLSNPGRDRSHKIEPDPFSLSLLALERLSTEKRIRKADRSDRTIEGIRFKVALSFPGEKRRFVSRVADALRGSLGKDAVFYDLDYQAQLARPNLDTLLQRIYREQSDLIVVFLCTEYASKEWCGLEWRAVRDIIKSKQDDRIMFVRFDDVAIDGLFSIDGYVNAATLTAAEVAELILARAPRQ